MSEARLVVFDAGGVLVRICRSWQEACAAAGEPFHPVAATPELMARRKAVVRRYETGGMTCAAYFDALAQTTDGLYTPEQVRRLHESWILGEYPGVADLVADLKSAGVRTGLLSNTNATHWRDLVSRRAIAGLDHPHASHLMGVAKPAPEIYAAFAAAVGRAPGQIVFFDDLPENVAAARAAGWDAAPIDHAGDTAAQMRAALVERKVL